ncbi:MAG: histidine kinase [Pyrinomonadaceae bacterium]
MIKSLAQESIDPGSHIAVELSEHCNDAPELYLRALLDASASGVAVLDESGTILYVNRSWRQLAVRKGLEHSLYGVGLNYIEICEQVSGVSAEEAAAVTEGITGILLGRELELQKEYFCHTSKARRWGLIHAARFDLPRAFRILVTHDVVTSSKQAGEAQEKVERLRQRTEETLINLSGLLINAQEEERKRIARELHDDLNQRMALLSIELVQLEQKIQKPRYLRPLVQSLQKKAQEISAEIHRLSYQLHPSKLDQLGLETAVESLCVEFSGSRQLKIEFHQRGFPTTVPNDVRLCVFRIAQESLRNCLKHSSALKAQVVLEKAEGIIRLSVSDDGCGFDTESAAMKKGLGFTSMRERLRLVSGEMRIHSQPLSGTRIEISVPLTEGN